jgi:hypothetical protein
VVPLCSLPDQTTKKEKNCKKILDKIEFLYLYIYGYMITIFEAKDLKNEQEALSSLI